MMAHTITSVFRNTTNEGTIKIYAIKNHLGIINHQFPLIGTPTCVK
jgi:hypothetical protein